MGKFGRAVAVVTGAILGASVGAVLGFAATVSLARLAFGPGPVEGIANGYFVLVLLLPIPAGGVAGLIAGLRYVRWALRAEDRPDDPPPDRTTPTRPGSVSREERKTWNPTAERWARRSCS